MIPLDDDIRLRQRLAAGEQSALEHVYDHCSSAVHGVAVQVTHCDEAAAEITRDVFVHLWEHPYAFDPGSGSLRSWLASLARRRAAEWLEREECTP